MTVRKVVVIPMAGDSLRFSSMGVSTPKWKLRAAGRSLLEWSLLSIVPSLESAHVVLVARSQDIAPVRTAARGEGFPRSVETVMSPDGPRAGQARDAQVGCDSLPKRYRSLPLIVWNIDTIILPPSPTPSYGNWMQLARKRGSAWSFAQLAGPSSSKPSLRSGAAELYEVARTAEKVRISPWASTGLYGFASVDSFCRLTLAHAHDPGELYVAPLYNDLIAAGEKVYACTVTASAVTAMGTPEQFIAGCRSRSWRVPDELSQLAFSMPPL